LDAKKLGLKRKIAHIKKGNIANHIKHIYGPERIEYNANEAIVCCLVRNGELYMKSFIEHYFNLGFKHIVFLDNVSTDNSIKMAKQYDNITILESNLSYKYFQIPMKQYLMRNFCSNKWGLLVDIDEFFDYPYSNSLPLAGFLEYLNKYNYTTVIAYMLDMFSEKPIGTLGIDKNDSLKDKYNYYDTTNIIKLNFNEEAWISKCKCRLSNNSIKSYYGGIRKTIFPGYSSPLTKFPLLALKKAVPFVDPHYSNNVFVADISCVLLHYFFMDNFYHKIDRIVKEKEYKWMKGYEIIKKSMRRGNKLELKLPTSKKLTHVNQLIGEGFLVVSNLYLDWVKEYFADSVANKKL
jgi:hypothetical protein